MYRKQLTVALAGTLLSLAASACDLEIPDENNPGLGDLENAPTPASVNTATTGLLVGLRAGKSATVGYVNMLGILGRESLDFDSADSRFVTELLQSTLSKTSPFGGAFWLNSYANIRQAHIILHGTDKLADEELSPAQKAGVHGFVDTIIALELMTTVITRDDLGAVIDTDRPLTAALGAFVSKAEVYAEIVRLLDQAKVELADAGETFSFPLSAGFPAETMTTPGFNTPETFIPFISALRARVDVYTKNYQAALTDLAASFLVDDPADPAFSFTYGVSHSYSTATGDARNALIHPQIYAHQTLQTDAQKQANGDLDARFVAKIDFLRADLTKPIDNDKNKITPVTYATDSSLTTTLKFKIYKNITSIPIIRNEELILLKAEALWFTGDKVGALAELNIVRTGSGKLPPLVDIPLDDNGFVDLLLYERRYSLMYEGGYRWIDLRRFGRPIPLDSPAHVRNVRYPIPQQECDGRAGEPVCELTSAPN